MKINKIEIIKMLNNAWWLNSACIYWAETETAAVSADCCKAYLTLSADGRTFEIDTLRDDETYHLGEWDIPRLNALLAGKI